MNSKLLFIAIVLALGGFMLNNHLRQKAKPQVPSAEELQVQREVKTAVSQLSEQHNAITDWDEQLCKGKGYHLSPVLTIELESLWQSARPILFTGTIKNISSADANAYHVVVKSSFHYSMYFNTDMELYLTAPKAMVDTYLKKYGELHTADPFANVAVVAKIHSITSNEERDEDGLRSEKKTGHGDLLDLCYMGNVSI